jgi:hypothetical protein
MRKDRAERILEWSERIRKQKISVQSARAWCHEIQVTYANFIAWLARFNNNDSQISSTPQAHYSQPNTSSLEKTRCFIELQESSKAGSRIALEYAGIQIHLFDNCDAVLLRKCLNVLRGITVSNFS